MTIFFAILLSLGLLSFGAAAEDARPVEDAKKMGLQQKAKATLPTIWLIGDSTVKVGTAGQRGWGEEIAPFFDLSKVNVVNRAIGGRSSRTFLTEGRWDAILQELKAGDVVVMQFGHNDAGPVNEKPPVTKDTRARGSIRGNGEETEAVDNILTKKHEVVHSYGWYIRNYVATAQAKGATAVVCSPIPRHSWANGKVKRAAESYGGWAKQAAGQAGALFVDLNEIIATGYEKAGEEAVGDYFPSDHTHTGAAGALFNAQCVVDGLKALGEKNPAAQYFSTKPPVVPIPKKVITGP